MSKWLFFPTTAGGGSDYTDYMAAYAGVDHAVISFGTSITAQITLVGNGLSTWSWYSTTVSTSYPANTVSGVTVTTPATNKRALHGPYLGQSNPYQYVAIGYREASTQYLGVQSAGWIILEREATIGTLNPSYQGYYPTEGTAGINGVTPYANGALPAYTTASAGSLSMVMFFFDGYIAGDVDTWTIWDGSTVP